MTHELKTVQPYFNDLLDGKKSFEVRKNDRGFKVFDSILLKEWDGEKFTGRGIAAYVSYILDNPDYCKEGYVVIGLVNRLFEEGGKSEK